MPTLLRVEGFRFSFFAGDGVEPPHVHVSKGDAAAKIWLQPIRIAYAHGFSPGVAPDPRAGLSARRLLPGALE
jgi:hypothetical protein